MGTTRTTFDFGPGGVLVGSITSPEHAKTDLGAILWGMGIAELKIARRLAKAGVTVIQIRINDGNHFKDFDKRNQMYDSSGVSYCRMAMDFLANETSVTRFILMGNCACANVSFNATVIDERVVGLIMTNPTFMELQILVRTFFSVLADRQAWQRLFSGITKPRAILGSLRALTAKRQGDATGQMATNLRAKSEFQGDLPLPSDFDAKLKRLTARGVDTLLVFSSTELGLEYLTKTYAAALAELRRGEKFQLEVIDAKVHVFSTDDEAASTLSQTISKWVEGTLPNMLHS